MGGVVAQVCPDGAAAANKARAGGKAKDKAKATDGDDEDGLDGSDDEDEADRIAAGVELDDEDEFYDERLASATAAVKQLQKDLETLNSTIEVYKDKIKTRAEELFEQLRAIPAGLEDEFRDIIEKNLRAQKEFREEMGNYATGEVVQVMAYVLNLPLQDFMFQRVIVDEVQMLRNMDSGHSRLVRLLTQRCNSLHMLSATPALNRLEDIRALGSLA